MLQHVCNKVTVNIVGHLRSKPKKILMTGNSQIQLLASEIIFVPWHNRFLLPQDSNAPTICLTTPHFKTNTHHGKGICSFNNAGAWCEKHNCLGWKLETMKHALCAALRQVHDRAQNVFSA